MGLFGGGNSGGGGFLGSIGKAFGEVTGTLFSLPNRIIDFGVGLGNQQAQFLAQQGSTIQQQQQQFQARQAGLGFGDFISNNPLLVFGGIGLILFFVLRK